MESVCTLWTVLGWSSDEMKNVVFWKICSSFPEKTILAKTFSNLFLNNIKLLLIYFF